MSRLSIKRVIPALGLGLLLSLPMPALADVSSSPQAAASAGVQYLANNQGVNGSISGFGGESEWSVEAVEAAGQDASIFAHNGSPSLADFLKSDAPAPGAPTTTIERKIIAIAAAGQDPTNFGGVNYDASLEGQHVSNQIGDATLLNDDIFGIIAIDAAHATQLQAEAQDGLTYLLAHQAADGGFSYSADSSCAFCGSDNNDTAAAIIAMCAAQHLGLTAANLGTARSNALTYLLSTQQSDGGFAYDAFSPSDGSSTAWSLMALNTIGDPVSAQALLARNWLLHNQNPDGGFTYAAFGTTDSDTYTTAHAVIALLGSTWLLRPTPLSPPVSQSPAASPGGTQSSVSVGTSSNASPTQASPAVQPAVTITTSDSTSPDEPIIDETVATPQTTVSAPDNHTQKAAPTHPFATAAHKAPKYTLYGAGLLILAALIWLVLDFGESTKSTEGQQDVK